MPILCKARDRQLRFQLDSGREHPPCDMSSSETGHCYSEIDVQNLCFVDVLESARIETAVPLRWCGVSNSQCFRCE
eukprot:gene26407-biopygen3393